MSVIREILDAVLTTIMRLFVSPCYGCKHETDCKIFAERGYCGDYGYCEYERSDNI